MDKKAKIEPKPFVPSSFCPWPLFTKQDLQERSPTRLYFNPQTKAGGYNVKREEALLKTSIELIKSAGAALELHHAIPTAILFARRYYATKAMQENDRFIVVCACLFLAGKCEEEMKPLNDVCYQTYKIRYNNNAEALKNMGEVTFFNHFKEIVLTAERALLYTLGFQLGVQHPYYWMRTITKRLAELPGDGQFWKEFESKTGGIRNNFCNDLYVRTTLVLRYDLRIIAFALMHITLPVMFPDIGRPKADHDKVPLIDLMPWYSYVLKTEREDAEASGAPICASRPLPSSEPAQKVTSALLIEVGKEIMGLYTVKKSAGQSQAPEVVELKPEAPEVVGPDGPITPLLEEFGTPLSDGSPNQVDAQGKPVENGAKPSSEAPGMPAGKADGKPVASGVQPSHEAPAMPAGKAQGKPVENGAKPSTDVPTAQAGKVEGQPVGDGAKSSSEAPSSPAGKPSLDPKAPAFVPGAAQASAAGGAAPEHKSSAQAAAQQANGQQAKRKRSSEDAGPQAQDSPAKRAVPEKTDAAQDKAAAALPEAAVTEQPAAVKQSKPDDSIPGIDAEVKPSGQQAFGQPKRKRSSDEAGLEAQGSPAKRAVLDKAVHSIADGAPQVNTAAAHEAASPEQPVAAKQSPPADGIPGIDAEIKPSAVTAPTQVNGNGNGSAAAAKEAAPSVVKVSQPAAGAAALYKQPSAASEEGDLVAEIQTLVGASEPQPAADPAANSERLKKWQAGQSGLKQASAEENRELGAELEGLEECVQPKQAPADKAAASERLKKWQQLQATAAQNGH